MSEPVDLGQLKLAGITCDDNGRYEYSKEVYKAIAEIRELREKNKILQLLKEDPENLPDEIAAQCCLMSDPLHFHHAGCPSEDGELNGLLVRISHLERELNSRTSICQECGKEFVGDSP